MWHAPIGRTVAIIGSTYLYRWKENIFTNNRQRNAVANESGGDNSTSTNRSAGAIYQPTHCNNIYLRILTNSVAVDNFIVGLFTSGFWYISD